MSLTLNFPDKVMAKVTANYSFPPTPNKCIGGSQRKQLNNSTLLFIRSVKILIGWEIEQTAAPIILIEWTSSKVDQTTQAEWRYYQ